MIFTCIEEFGVGETMAPMRKQSICITIKPDTTYISFRPDIFSIIQPVVIVKHLMRAAIWINQDCKPNSLLVYSADVF